MFKRFLLLIICMLSLSLFGSANWTQEEIKYFQEKEYVGDERFYPDASLDIFPPYILEKLKDKGISRLHLMTRSCFLELLKHRFHGKLGRETMEEIARYLRLLRNEIYARHGYIFKSEDLRYFFNKMSWYTSRKENVKLKGEEGYNIKRIKKVEEAVKVGIERAEMELDYKKEVIVEAPWGDKPGELGMDSMSAPPVGPRDFYVADNGNIYVLDQVNDRVQIFDSKGTFQRQIRYNKKEISDSLAGVLDVTVDNNGNVYLLGILDYPSRGGIIGVFGDDGEYIGKIKLPVKMFMPSLEEFKKYGGYWGLGQMLGGLEEFQIKEGSITLTFENKIYLLGETSLLKIKQRGFSHKASIAAPLDSYSSLEQRTLTLYKWKKNPEVQLVGRDKEGGFFIRRAYHEILKFNSSGELLGSIIIPVEQPEYDMGEELLVSKDGNLYYWTNDKNGLKIVRISK